jgi:hypothetical protein
VTISRWYWVHWNASENLSFVLGKYVSHKNKNLKEALRKVADIEGLFRIRCTIESRSMVGTILVRKRIQRTENDVHKNVVITADEQVNAILKLYHVSNEKAVQRLFGRALKEI